MGKTVFNKDWLKKYKWLSDVPNEKRSTFCRSCRQKILLGTMGEAALKSHMKGSRHKKNVLSACAPLVFATKTEEKVSSPGSSIQTDESQSDRAASPAMSLSVPKPGVPQPSIASCASKSNLKAEVLWTLKTITDHNSYRSNETVGPIFKAMFNDSHVAELFSCGERKTAYLAQFGIAPFFREAMIKNIKGPYCVLYDELLNKKMDSKQMDLHVRYLNGNTVRTSYSYHVVQSCLRSGLEWY
jgi:hypothetical protein